MKNLKIEKDKILLVAIGNNGRSDDGLGWKFADQLRETDLDFFDVEYRYQLQVEDAELISHYTKVLFVDASHEVLKDGFEINPCLPKGYFFFSSHLQSPEAILYLAEAVFNKAPKAYTISISGFDWELRTCLSKMAEKNLQNAFNYFEKEFVTSIRYQLISG